MRTIFFLILFAGIGFCILYFLDEGMLSPEQKLLKEKTIQFIDAIKFKDFKSAAKLHSLDDNNRKNIPALIERKFAVKPEFLNFTDYEVNFVEINKAGNRARVKTNITVELLNSKQADPDKGNKIKTIEMIFYWQKQRKQVLSDDGKTIKKLDGKYEWYHKLESSL